MYGPLADAPNPTSTGSPVCPAHCPTRAPRAAAIASTTAIIASAEMHKTRYGELPDDLSVLVDEGMLKDQFDSGGGSGVAGGGGAPTGQGYVFSYSPPHSSSRSDFEKVDGTGFRELRIFRSGLSRPGGFACLDSSASRPLLVRFSFALLTSTSLLASSCKTVDVRTGSSRPAETDPTISFLDADWQPAPAGETRLERSWTAPDASRLPETHPRRLVYVITIREGRPGVVHRTFDGLACPDLVRKLYGRRREARRRAGLRIEREPAVFTFHEPSDVESEAGLVTIALDPRFLDTATAV